MKVSSETLIDDLIERTRQNLNAAEKLMSYSTADLNRRPAAEKWSALECIEHLNRYGDFYLSEIRDRIEQTNSKAEKQFKSSWLGEYFAKSMLPREKLNKMKTFKSMNPIGSKLDKSCIETFIDQQKELLNLLAKARAVSLKRVKTGISISAWVKLRLGDTFRVVIYHNQRHILQAQKALNPRASYQPAS